MLLSLDAVGSGAASKNQSIKTAGFRAVSKNKCKTKKNRWRQTSRYTTLEWTQFSFEII